MAQPIETKPADAPAPGAAPVETKPARRPRLPLLPPLAPARSGTRSCSGRCSPR